MKRLPGSGFEPSVAARANGLLRLAAANRLFPITCRIVGNLKFRKGVGEDEYIVCK